MFTYPQPYALELGMTSVRGFFIAYCSFALAARVLLGPFTDRLGRFPVAVAALNLYTLVVLATAGLRPGMLEPLGALMGLAHGLFFPAVQRDRDRGDSTGRARAAWSRSSRQRSTAARSGNRCRWAY
jgi:MFS family permease